MNQLTLIGNLCADPELITSASGIEVCNFSLAVSRRFAKEGDPQADFFRCVCFKATATNLAKYCKKGAKIAVVGSGQFEEYVDKEDIKRTSFKVLVNQIEFLVRSENNGSGENRTSNSGTKKQATLEPFDDDNDDSPF